MPISQADPFFIPSRLLPKMVLLFGGPSIIVLVGLMFCLKRLRKICAFLANILTLRVGFIIIGIDFMILVLDGMWLLIL